LVRTMLKLYKDEMQARSEPSTAPPFVLGDKMQSLQRTSSYLDSLTESSVIKNLELYSRRTYRETHLQTTVASDGTLTPGVSCQKSKTMLYIFTSTCCPIDCSNTRRLVMGSTFLSTSPLCASSRYLDEEANIFALHDTLEK
jgi:hypothetical protein